MKIEINRCTLTAGDALTVTFRDAPQAPFKQLEVEIYTAGTPNAEFAIGTTRDITQAVDGSYALSVETENLKHGFYEVCLARLSAMHIESPEIQPKHQVIWKKQPGQSRICFEISLNSRVIDQSNLTAEVERLDEKIEYDFLEPVCVILDSAQPVGSMFSVFVFVQRLLIGTRMRFAHHEIVPIGDGLEANDELDAINSFLRTCTKVNETINRLLKYLPGGPRPQPLRRFSLIPIH